MVIRTKYWITDKSDIPVQQYEIEFILLTFGLSLIIKNQYIW